MQIMTTDTSGAMSLIDGGNFTAFSVGGCRPDEAGVARLAGCGVHLDDDGGHAFVEPAAVEALADCTEGLSVDASWRDGLVAMIEFATNHGWVDADGRMRAHTEWAE